MFEIDRGAWYHLGGTTNRPGRCSPPRWQPRLSNYENVSR